MDRKKVKEELLRCNKGRPFISLTDLAKVMHVGKDNARTIVSGLSYYTCGRRKDFLVDDVAKRIADASVLMNGDMTRKIKGLKELEKRIEAADENAGESTAKSVS